MPCRVAQLLYLLSWHRYFLGPGQTVPQILALGLSSRKNLCVHPSVAGAFPAATPLSTSASAHCCVLCLLRG